MKYKAYVGIIINFGTEIRGMKFVTEVESRTARWKAGEPAKAFTLSAAKDICFGLNSNGFHAAVVQLPYYFKPFINPND